MDDLLNEFLVETSDRLAELDADITQFASAPADAKIQARLLDLMHTIKGTSGFLALPRLEAISQSCEDVLGRVQAGAIAASPTISAPIIEAIGVMRRILLGLASSGREPEGDDRSVLETLLAAGDGRVRAQPEPTVPAAEPEPAKAVVSMPSEAPAENAENRSSPPTAIAISPAASAKNISIPAERLESFADLVGQLVQTRNNLEHLVRARDDSELEETVQRLSHITSDLGSGVVATRRQALGSAASQKPGDFDIVTAVTVASSGQRYAIPQRNIIELIWVTPTAGLGSAQDEFRFLRLRDRRYPWVRLSTLLKTKVDQALARRREIVVMIQVGDEALGLSVEQVYDAEEIVVRPQPPILRNITLFVGNTVLGDGTVALVLDPMAIASELKLRQQLAVAARVTAPGGLPSGQL